MIIIENDSLNKQFLEACGLPSLRGFINESRIAPGVSGRSRNDILPQIQDRVQMTPAEFRQAAWMMMNDQAKGGRHVALSTINNLPESHLSPLEQIFRTRKALTEAKSTVATNDLLDISYSPERSELRLLFVGEAEAELYDEHESYKETKGDSQYLFKAYRLVDVPVIAEATIAHNAPYISIVTRAIHQKVKPSFEVDRIREAIQNIVDFPIPPIGGISNGITALWCRGVISPRRALTEESDRTRVQYITSGNTQNPESQQVENLVRNWQFQSGSMLYRDGTIKVPFHVDAGRSVFSFGTRVSRQDEQHVIHSIIAAA